MRKRLTIVSALALIVVFFSTAVNMDADTEEPDLIVLRGVVISVEEDEAGSPLVQVGYDSKAYRVAVRVQGGPYQGRVLSINHLTSGEPAFDIVVNPGNRVMLQASEQDGELTDIYITGFIRDVYVYWTVGLFVLFVLLLGGRSGLKSLLGLLLTAGLIIWVYLPLLMQGISPVPLAVAVSAVAVIATMVIVAGINQKTFAAVLGTVGGVVVAGALAVCVGRVSHLTGLSADEAQMLLYIPQEVSFDHRGLLFGGMVIGALGAVMDVGMSISSALFEMRRLRPDLSGWQLFRSGMNVGRDIMGTMTNTLILAYTGASTSMLLLFCAYEIPLEQIMNMDLIATELVRALSGSIGLVAAIPLTAAAAAWLSTLGRGRPLLPHQDDSPVV